MKMKNCLIIFIILLFSCSKDSNSNDANNIDAMLDIILTDSNGNNLYGSPSFLQNNINYFHLINGQISTPIGNSSSPTFFEQNGINKMRIFLNSDITEEFPVTYIVWNESDTDTLKAHFNRGSENNEDFEICDQVWLNEVLIWDATQWVNGREITIVK